MIDNLLELLEGCLVNHRLPDGLFYQSVSLFELQRLAGSSAKVLRAIMIRCLENGIWPACFRSNRGALSETEQILLLQSGVAVIGAGGLGGMVVQGLARVGVGRLRVCDGDRFEESNLNRQLLSRLDNLGRNKAECAREEVQAINPAIEVNVFDRWATPINLFEILEGCRVAIDCLDNLKTRYQLQAASKQAGIPVVHGSVGGWEGFMMTVWPTDPGLENVFGQKDQNGQEEAVSPIGIPSFTPALVASLQVSQVVMLLLGRPGIGRGKVFHTDASVPSIDLLHISDA